MFYVYATNISKLVICGIEKDFLFYDSLKIGTMISKLPSTFKYIFVKIKIQQEKNHQSYVSIFFKDKWKNVIHPCFSSSLQLKHLYPKLMIFESMKNQKSLWEMKVF